MIRAISPIFANLDDHLWELAITLMLGWSQRIRTDQCNVQWFDPFTVAAEANLALTGSVAERHAR